MKAIELIERTKNVDEDNAKHWYSTWGYAEDERRFGGCQDNEVICYYKDFFGIAFVVKGKTKYYAFTSRAQTNWTGNGMNRGFERVKEKNYDDDKNKFSELLDWFKENLDLKTAGFVCDNLEEFERVCRIIKGKAVLKNLKGDIE